MNDLKCQEKKFTVGYVNDVKAVSEFKTNDDGTETLTIAPILVDKSSSGRERPWRAKKVSNLTLAKIYDYLATITSDDYFSKRAERLRSCAVFLKFNVIDEHRNVLKLKKISNSCRVRLCPVCAWRRTLKISSHARKIFNYVETSEEYANKYDYLLLTLTVPNVYGGQLSSTIDNLMKSFDRLMKRREVKKIVCGWYRGLEVTFNKYEFISEGLYRRCKGYFDALNLRVGDRNPNFGTYHPHFHVILCVPKSYLSNHNDKVGYLSNEKWLQFWRECTRNDDITQVDIRPISAKKSATGCDPLQGNGLINAICEVTKYTVKDKDYIITYDWDLSADCVATLDNALKNRRLVAWGGVLKEIHKRLNLDDEIDGDLVNIDDDAFIEGETVMELSAFWHVGYQEYIIYDVKEKSVEEVKKEENFDKLSSVFMKKSKRNIDKKVIDSIDDASTSFTFDVPDLDKDAFDAFLTKKRAFIAVDDDDKQLELF